MAEHRAHPRREVSIETRLLLPGVSRHEKAVVVPCRLVDVSQSGARILLNARYRLPRKVFILRGEDENSYEARTVWQDGQSAGLQFVELCTRARHQELIEQMQDATLVSEEPKRVAA